MANDSRFRRLVRSRGVRFGLPVGLIALVVWTLTVHPFLAVTSRVDADVLVVEGWVPEHVMEAAAAEFRAGHYRILLTSGLESEEGKDPIAGGSYAALAKSTVEGFGIAAADVVACPTTFTTWTRTAATARAVRDRLRELDVTPAGVNVVTAGPHARETWVAYQHAFGDHTPVGIISIPKKNYDADGWWTSRHGLIWVPKDFLGWLKEVVIGQQT